MDDICGDGASDTMRNFAGAVMWKMRAQGDMTRQFVGYGSQERRFLPTVIFQLKGGALLHQDGSCRLAAGHFAYVDAGQSFELVGLEGNEQLCLTFPSSAILKQRFLARRAVAVSQESELDRLFVACAREAWELAQHMRPFEEGDMLRSLTSLCSLSTPFRDWSDRKVMSVRLTRTMRYIEMNLAEPWLTPAKVAAAQGVTRRYLDDLLRESGYSLSSWIWQRRTERAMAELHLYGGGVGNATKSILQIALDCGFKSSSHFCRRFIETFDISPRECRKKLLAGEVGLDGPVHYLGSGNPLSQTRRREMSHYTGPA